MGSLRNLRTLDAGFDPTGVLIVDADLRRVPWPEDQRGAMRAQVLERARALPGVRFASISDLTPLGGSAWNGQIFTDGFSFVLAWKLF